MGGIKKWCRYVGIFISTKLSVTANTTLHVSVQSQSITIKGHFCFPYPPMALTFYGNFIARV